MRPDQPARKLVPFGVKMSPGSSANRYK